MVSAYSALWMRMEKRTYRRRETANHLPKEGLDATVALEDCSQKVFSSLGHAALRSLRALGEIRLHFFQIIPSKSSHNTILIVSETFKIVGGSVSKARQVLSHFIIIGDLLAVLAQRSTISAFVGAERKDTGLSGLGSNVLGTSEARGLARRHDGRCDCHTRG